jgi:hypothetical protein
MRNSGRRQASCQRGARGVALGELPVVAPQPDIVAFVIKRVNDDSLPVGDNDNGATGVTPSSQVMNAVAEATGVESAPSEPTEWAQSGADLGLPHGSLNLSSLAIVA